MSVSLLQGDRVVHALRDVSFHAPSGRLTGICDGSSAYGGAMVLEVARRERRPDSGRVLCGSRSLFSWQGRRTRIASAIPASVLLEAARDLLEYVAFGALDRGLTIRAAEFEAYEALERVGLRDLAAEKASVLSTTERVRAALASALLARPDVLLANDPVVGMGDDRGRLLDLLRAYAEEEDVAVLITLRRMADLRQCHERLLLDGSRLVQASRQVDILVPERS